MRGELAPDAVPSRLRELDCLVAPSIWAENAPLGVQEALAQGTPVVATDLGGHGELLAQGGGLLVPPGDEPALLAALLRLSRERGLAGELAARAPAPRPLDEHLRALREIYEGLVSRPVGSGGPLDAP